VKRLGVRRWGLFATVWLLIGSTGCLCSGTSVQLRRETPTTASNMNWSQKELDYFVEVALGAEYGSSVAEIKKWRQNPRIKVFGNPTDVDRETVQQVVDDLNSLQNQIALQVVSQRPNIKIHFAPESEFAQIEPQYQPTNYGFFWTWWKGTREIYKARILIATDHINQRERSHLIREELTQCLGLMRDSERYPDSMFYSGWTDVTEYAPVDKAVIRILYSDAVQLGMDRDQVLEALKEN
jgi:hypothetical protein